MQANPKPTILIADDNALMRELLASVLRESGIYDVLRAANGIEVIEIYREKRPDIVFLDIQMPDPDGLATLSKIRELNAKAFVVMVSGYSSAENVKTAIDTGAKGFIVKPFSVNRVMGIINKYQAEAS